MISAAVWVTSNEARVFTFKTEGVQSQHLHRHGKTHPAEVHGKNHPKENGDSDHFYHEVTEALIAGGSERWLILGPGPAKNHLRNHIDRHHSQLANRVVAVEAMDKVNDGQIRDFAHRYFQKQGVFEGLQSKVQTKIS